MLKLRFGVTRWGLTDANVKGNPANIDVGDVLPTQNLLKIGVIQFFVVKESRVGIDLRSKTLVNDCALRMHLAVFKSTEMFLSLIFFGRCVVIGCLSVYLLMGLVGQMTSHRNSNFYFAQSSSSQKIELIYCIKILTELRFFDYLTCCIIRKYTLS